MGDKIEDAERGGLELSREKCIVRLIHNILQHWVAWTTEDDENRDPRQVTEEEKVKDSPWTGCQEGDHYWALKSEMLDYIARDEIWQNIWKGHCERVLIDVSREIFEIKCNDVVVDYQSTPDNRWEYKVVPKNSVVAEFSDISWFDVFTVSLNMTLSKLGFYIKILRSLFWEDKFWSNIIT